MAVLAILQADARTAARLTAALSGDHEVVVRQSWDGLKRALGRASFDACVLEGDHPDRETATRRIAWLRTRHPSIAIIAYVGASHAVGYYDLGELGVAGVLAAGPQPAAKTRMIVEQALARARADQVVQALKGRFAPPGPDAVGWAVEHAGPDTSVERLAAALGHTPASLRGALEEAGAGR